MDKWKRFSFILSKGISGKHHRRNHVASFIILTSCPSRWDREVKDRNSVTNESLITTASVKGSRVGGDHHHHHAVTQLWHVKE
jgi:hypothetical protein